MPTPDSAASVAVLPDHRLRIAADVEIGGSRDIRRRRPAARREADPAFGGGDGIAELPPAAADDLVTGSPPTPRAPRAHRLGGAGPAHEDTFVAVLAADGTPDAGFGVVVADHGGTGRRWRRRRLGRAGTRGARGARRRPARTAILHAFTAPGRRRRRSRDRRAGPPARPGRITAGGLVTYGGRLWATGAVQVGNDIDAYLARVAEDGSDKQVRRFDMRGSVFPGTQQVASVGEDLTIVPGEPDTLVVGGSVTTDSGTEVGAAAFNLLDGALAALQAVELAIPVPGQGERRRRRRRDERRAGAHRGHAQRAGDRRRLRRRAASGWPASSSTTRSAATSR